MASSRPAKYRNVEEISHCSIPSTEHYQAAANPAMTAINKPPAVKETAPLEGTVVVAAPSAPVELSPIGELCSDDALALPVLRVMEEEPVRVDMLVRVDAPVVVVIDEAAVVLEASSLLVEAALLLVAASELGAEDTGLTVFFDSTTNGAE